MTTSFVCVYALLAEWFLLSTMSPDTCITAQYNHGMLRVWVNMILPSSVVDEISAILLTGKKMI